MADPKRKSVKLDEPAHELELRIDHAASSGDPKDSASQWGNIRSPLTAGSGKRSDARLAVASQAPSPLSQSSSSQVPRGRGPTATGVWGRSRQEGSQRRRVHDAVGNDLATGLPTHLEYVMFDPAPARRWRLFWLSLGLGLVLGTGVLVYSPAKRQMVWAMLEQAQDRVQERIETANQPRRKSKSRILGDAHSHAAKTVATDAPASHDRSTSGKAALRRCAELRQSDSGGMRLKLGDRIALAECFLAAGDLANAESTLRPLSTTVRNASEASLNGTASSGTLAEAQQVLLGILLKAGKSQQAGELVRGQCVKWAQTNTCVSKAMLYADRKLAAPGIGVLFESQGRLDSKAQARLWLAGAQLAGVEGRLNLADRRYGLALAAAPKDALVLRKQIYETQAMDLYRRGTAVTLREVVERALRDLRGLDVAATMKLRILRDLVTSNDRGKVIKTLLTREEVTFRARRDVDLVAILGPESFRIGYETDYLRLLRRSQEYYSVNRATDPIARQLAGWEIRATISGGDHEQARALIQSYIRDHGADGFAHHMFGVAYHLGSPHPRYQALAAREFQAALRVRYNWESLYALGVTSMRAGQSQHVAHLIRDLEKMVVSPGQRYWADMLKAEWYIAQGQYAQAQVVLDKYKSKREPRGRERDQPYVLQVHLYERAGRAAESRRALLQWQERSRGVLGKSWDTFTSPLGVMALSVRPL